MCNYHSPIIFNNCGTALSWCFSRNRCIVSRWISPNDEEIQRFFCLELICFKSLRRACMTMLSGYEQCKRLSFACTSLPFSPMCRMKFYVRVAATLDLRYEEHCARRPFNLMMAVVRKMLHYEIVWNLISYEKINNGCSCAHQGELPSKHLMNTCEIFPASSTFAYQHEYRLRRLIWNFVKIYDSLRSLVIWKFVKHASNTVRQFAHLSLGTPSWDLKRIHEPWGAFMSLLIQLCKSMNENMENNVNNAKSKHELIKERKYWRNKSAKEWSEGICMMMKTNKMPENILTVKPNSTKELGEHSFITWTL